MPRTLSGVVSGPLGSKGPKRAQNFIKGPKKGPIGCNSAFSRPLRAKTRMGGEKGCFSLFQFYGMTINVDLVIVKARIDSSLNLYEHCVACDNENNCCPAGSALRDKMKFPRT